MKTGLLRWLFLSVLGILPVLLIAGCVKETFGEDGVRIPEQNQEFEDVPEELVISEQGLIIASVTRIIDPVTLEVNVKVPRIIKIPGVAGPDKEKMPNLYDEALGELYRLIEEHRNVIYFRPKRGIDLEAKVITATMMLPHRQDSQYWYDVTQGMLSKGYYRIEDEAEFQSPVIIESMRKREMEAQFAGLGIWAGKDIR